MVEINPFDDLIVKEPRRPEPAVNGLNDAALQAVLGQFQRLAQGNLPRAQHQLPHAQLVTSGQPGLGKSHLIGRLFRSLHGRATLVYVRPFQNPSLAFHSLLAAVVKEMSFPDRVDVDTWRPSEPTQLDTLAFGVLAHLVADLAERDPSSDPTIAPWLREDPVSAFGEGLEVNTWAKWMCETFKSHHAAYEQALAQRGVELHSPDWLRVLFAYAFNYPNAEVRQACLDWMAGQPLSAEQGALVGLRPAELLAAEAPAEVLNHASRERLVDLCRLAVFYRPFVFCFDQTEFYGHSTPLARSLGMVLATLVNEGANQLTLITSNKTPWTQTISPHFEEADRARIAEPPISLDGLNRAQGEELIRLRLESCGRGDMLGKMCAADWLDGHFASESEQKGARQFLQLCKNRWVELHDQPPPAAATLPELYEERRLKLLADPKRLSFDADALQWLVEQCAALVPGIAVQPGEVGYFTVGWQTPQRRVLFGFEPGSNWKRWAAIAREAGDRVARGGPTKAVFFRDAKQPAIPGPSWVAGPAIEEAKREHLHLIVLSRDDLAALYAGYDLYFEALGGDVPPHDARAVVTYLRETFAHWWQRLAGAVEGGEPVPQTDGGAEKELAARVRTIVSAQKFLSIEEVIVQLGGGATQDEVLKACSRYASIRIHAHPQMTVLQWQSL